MKAEERHQLKENDLGNWLQYGFPLWIKENGSYVLLVLALGFLGYQLYHMYERKQENYRTQAFAELRAAGATENPIPKLQSVIETYDLKDLRLQANLMLGGALNEALLYPERLSTYQLSRAEAIAKAGTAYQKALDLAGDDPLTAGKAITGLAAVAEAKDDWGGARAQYEALAGARFKDTPWVAIGVARLASLEDRQKAPRLAEHMPPPPPPSTAPAAGVTLPGAFGNPVPTPEFGPAAPFMGPSIPGIGPDAPAGATQPAVPALPAVPATSPK